jgi:hypothetical protein
MTETVREGRDRGRVSLVSPYRESKIEVYGETLSILPTLPNFFKGFFALPYGGV